MFLCMTGVQRLKKDHAWQVGERILPPSHSTPADIWLKIKKETKPDVTGSLETNSCHMQRSYYKEIPAVFIK